MDSEVFLRNWRVRHHADTFENPSMSVSSQTRHLFNVSLLFQRVICTDFDNDGSVRCLLQIFPM